MTKNAWFEAAKADGRWEESHPGSSRRSCPVNGRRLLRRPRVPSRSSAGSPRTRRAARGAGVVRAVRVVPAVRVVRRANRRRRPRPGRLRGPEFRTPGPTGPEDAWMWEGVPAGEYLMGTPVPGKGRWYMGHDEHGKQIRSLPPAWPPGQRPEEGA